MDSEAIIKSIERMDIKPVYDRRFRRLYRKRASVERFFSKEQESTRTRTRRPSSANTT
jgi:hypothetical protein